MNKFFLLILLGGLFTCSHGAAQKKHALLFGVGDYPPEGKWETLAAANDVKHMAASLSRQGFATENIHTVLNAQVTVPNIIAELESLILRVEEKDIVLIHFSSHGQQIQDENGDETDGFDEAIVTYYAKAPDDDGHLQDFDRDKQHYFRDDKLGELITKLRKKLTGEGDVIVFLDLCHSGSGTRGTRKVRGGKPAIVRPGATITHEVKNINEVFAEENVIAGKELSTFAVFSAARAGEPTYQTTDDDDNDIGSLTYAVCKAFERLPRRATYESLFYQLQFLMNEEVPGQHPVLEGLYLNRALFGGDFVNQKSYSTIEQVKGKEIIINTGLFSGVDAGTIVGLYPSGTSDPSRAKAVSDGTVTNAGMYKSVVRLTRELADVPSSMVWVFIMQPSYKTEPVTLHIGSADKKNKASKRYFSLRDSIELTNSLSGLPLVKFGGEPEISLLKGQVSDSIKIASSGALFDTIENSLLRKPVLKEKVLRYAQFKFLSAFNVMDTAVNVEIAPLFFVNGLIDSAGMQQRMAGGALYFYEGEKIVLKVKNSGAKPVYFNVLDIQPNGIINPVFPNRLQNIYAGDLKIGPGTSRLFDKYVITIGPPYGNEIFKVFVSEEPIDMEIIAASKGVNVRSGFSPLEDIIRQTFEIGARNDGLHTRGLNGSAYNFMFEIKKKD